MARPFTSLYVHVPFCTEKCDYCAFYSVADASAGLRHRYLEQVRRQMECAAHDCAPLHSVYIGGGTPTALLDHEYQTLLQAVAGTFALAPGTEWTSEANPASMTAAKVDIMAEAGVNRVSVGVQSFNQSLRRAVGRRDALRDLQGRLGTLRETGIANLALDLIYGIPGETLAAWRADLQRAVELEPDHVSAYELTIEPGTALARRGAVAASDEMSVAMWHTAGEVLAESGIRRYEVSNHARPGCECRHNEEFWHGATYVGVGPAAASYDGEVRRTNPADLNRWLAGAEPEVDRLPAPKLAAEVLALGLRTVRGWRRQEFRSRTGADYMALCGEKLEELAARQMLELAPENVRPTEQGLLFADYVADRLMDP